jgi:hypothetical protein
MNMRTEPEKIGEMGQAGLADAFQTMASNPLKNEKAFPA